MSQESKDKDAKLPDAEVDPNVDRAPGGADASPNESDVGAGERTNGGVVTPDPPLSAQQDENEVPDPIQEPEKKDQANEEGTSEPEDEPAD
ncbi:MAG TPA: hypothetical protein VFG72_00190 [Marmoricola sp.]|nr:hypothetical protein [Marmoricola sp.]